jgi:hypothetical protein
VYRLSLAAAVVLAACSTTKPASTESTGGTTGPTAAPQQGGVVETRYDEAKDTTVVRLRPARALGEGTVLILGTTHPGRTPRRPETALLGFSRTAAAWRWEGCQTLTLIGGEGRTLATVPVSRDTQIGDGKLTEILSTVVPYEVVRALAASVRPAAKLCGDDRPFTDEECSAIRQLVQRLP